MGTLKLIVIKRNENSTSGVTSHDSLPLGRDEVHLPKDRWIFSLLSRYHQGPHPPTLCIAPVQLQTSAIMVTATTFLAEILQLFLVGSVLFSYLSQPKSHTQRLLDSVLLMTVKCTLLPSVPLNLILLRLWNCPHLSNSYSFSCGRSSLPSHLLSSCVSFSFVFFLFLSRGSIEFYKCELVL